MALFVFSTSFSLPHFCSVKKHLLIYHLMTKHIFTLLLSLAVSFSYGQGWERIYSGGGQDEAHAVAITPDGGYILAGVYSNVNLQLIKVDVDGFLQWSKFNLVVGAAQANAIVVTPDSSYVVAGWRGSGSSRDGFIMKTDFSGNLLWMNSIGVTGPDEITDMKMLADGSFVFTGTDFNNSQMRVVRTDASGNLLWSQNFGLLDFQEFGYGLTIANNGDIVAVGERRKDPNVKDIFVVRLTPSGNLVWENTFSIAQDVDEVGRSITAATDGGFVIAGFAKIQAVPQQGLLLKIDGNGSTIPVWFQTYPDKAQVLNDVENDGSGGFIVAGRTPEVGGTGVQNETYLARINNQGIKMWENSAGKTGLSEGLAVNISSDGGFVAVGYAATSTSPFSAQKYSYMVRTDAEGKLFTNYLSGKLYFDGNADCNFDNGETPLKDWLIRVESPDFTRYISTDADGKYFIMVDTGIYNLRVFTPNAYWTTCESNITVPIFTPYDTIDTEIGIVKLQNAPYNEVDIQTSILKRCTDNTYTVNYCNSGTIPSLNTTVTIEKSSEFAITDASLPYFQTGDSLIFNIGTLQPGQCGSFTLTAFLDCNVELGTAHCLRAHITPDTFSGNFNWDGAIIEARAACEEGRVKLSVANKGTNPNGNTLEYVIIEDLIVLFTIPPSVTSGFIWNLAPNGGDTTVYDIEATGKTYRLIAQQTLGYPGMSVPSAAVEGCVTDTTSSASIGYYTMFPDDDAEPFAASDCQEVNDVSFNPTFLKRGHPKGYDEPRYIRPETDLDYLIHFKNTGPNVVETVIVRDTLSPWLDPSSVRAGAASDAYDYQIYGNGIVEFRFNNINLAPEASGFAKFRVSQMPNLPCGTEILNQAAITYGFGAAEMTNQTLHTVCDSFLVTVSSKEIFQPGADLHVYPNPFTESALFEVTGVKAKEFTLEIFDSRGRLIFNQQQSASNFRLFRNQMPAGHLYYRLSADGKAIASGKLLVL